MGKRLYKTYINLTDILACVFKLRGRSFDDGPGAANLDLFSVGTLLDCMHVHVIERGRGANVHITLS